MSGCVKLQQSVWQLIAKYYVGLQHSTLISRDAQSWKEGIRYNAHRRATIEHPIQVRIACIII